MTKGVSVNSDTEICGDSGLQTKILETVSELRLNFVEHALSTSDTYSIDISDVEKLLSHVILTII